MKFIIAEQFEGAQDKVKDMILEWWRSNVSFGDLFFTNYGEYMVCRADENNIIPKGYQAYKKEFCKPLLTVGQLIEFIEWKLQDEIDIYRAGMKGHQIATEWIDGVGRSKHEFNPKSHDLLQALWEVAQEVAIQ